MATTKKSTKAATAAKPEENVDSTPAVSADTEEIKAVEDTKGTEEAKPVKESDETKSILSEIQGGIKDVTNKEIEMETNIDSVKIKSDELIMVRSMVRGGFNWKCTKSGIAYRWPHMGHAEPMPYEDLYQMFTNTKHYLTKPYVIVEDERVIKVFRLLNTYKNVASVNRLEAALNDKNAMKSICEQALQLNMRDLIIERLSQMRNNGVLNNIDVIYTAEQILKCELIKK